MLQGRARPDRAVAGRLLRRLRALSAALVVAIAALTTPAAADFETGRAAYVDGDFAAAIEAWRAPAETGAAAAQFALGTLYVTGEGVEQDFEAALSCSKKQPNRAMPAANITSA